MQCTSGLISLHGNRPIRWGTCVVRVCMPVPVPVPCTCTCTLYQYLYLYPVPVPCTCTCTLHLYLHPVHVPVPCTCASSSSLCPPRRCSRPHPPRPGWRSCARACSRCTPPRPCPCSTGGSTGGFSEAEVGGLPSGLRKLLPLPEAEAQGGGGGGGECWEGGRVTVE